ncbi:exodeoxyribonuclease VII large subunit [Solilutibacter silvestris]|nr:exodeoxyribonuclease VII large subunit [Lysobacter silvestris]
MDDRRDDVLTPSQLNTLARNLLEDTFAVVSVEGELGNVSRPASGHLYFTLKDARAQIRCALFRPKSQWLNFQPREGLMVLARGRVTLYEARGDYQLILDSLEEAGEGALRRAFEELRQKLQAEGLFDQARKRPLPRFVRRLGVITSPGGAAIHDVLSVLGRRFPMLPIDLLPVPVQGTGAAAQIADTLTRAANSGRYDALLLTRGGGSLEDLWAFNEEMLARAIAASAVPVVSAVGHESDVSLADFAADVRAATPSAAAELLSLDQGDLQRRLVSLERRLIASQQQMARQLAQRLDRAWLRLDAQKPAARLHALALRQLQLGQRLNAAWRRTSERDHARLRHAAAVLRARHPQLRLQHLRDRLAAIGQRPKLAIGRQLQQEALRLRSAVRALHAVSPLATVARGYAILSDDAGVPVQSVTQVETGQRIRARLHDGELALQVDAIHPSATEP